MQRCELDDEGWPLDACPVSQGLQERFDALGSLPTATRFVEASRLLHDAVLAHHWQVAIGLLKPETLESRASEAHLQIYRWWHALTRDGKPNPLVVCVNRGGGKTTSLELVSAMIAMEGLRSYALYIHALQDKAADAVGNIAEYLTMPIVAEAFPDVARRYETRLGTGRDWRKHRVRTASGFTIDALGMDQALRGAKLEDRPDLLVLDDLEHEHDTPYMTNKRESTLTRAIIPVLGPSGAIVYAQNRIHDDSMMARLIDGKADYLANRIMVGPIPQLRDLVIREARPDEPEHLHVIESGEPTWEALDLETSQAQLDDMGLPAFLSEKQHDTDVAEGTKFARNLWRIITTAPRDLRVIRSWDLAVTEGGGDWTVGALMGMDTKGLPYVLDVIRGQWNDADVEEHVRNAALADIEEFGRRGYRVRLEAQPGAAGKVWNRRWSTEVLAGIPHDLVPPQGSKSFRADGWGSAQQKGLAHLVNDEHLPAERKWIAVLIREHAQFPDFGRHDDIVDACALGYNGLTLGSKRASKVRSSAHLQL